MSDAIDLRPHERGTVLRVHVQPGAKRAGVAGRHGDSLKVRVTAPPVEGRANHEVLSVVSAALHLAPSTIELVSGATSRRKGLLLVGIDLDVARRLVDALSPTD